MARGAPATLARGAAAALAAAAFAAGCAGSGERAFGPAQWVEENRGVFGQLRSLDERERKTGVERFKRLGPEQGSAVALYVLTDPKVDDYRLELQLACILAEWQDRRAIPFLLQALEQPDDGAVRIAADALSQNFADSPRVIEHLADMLSRESTRDRLTAATLLAKIGSQQAAGLLGNRIRSELDPEVRAQLVIGIERSRHPGRLEHLIDALLDSDPAIRELAWNAVKRTPGLPRVDYAPEGRDVERAQAVGELRLWLRSRPGRR